MTAYGFADWEGNDRHFMGWAGTGVHFDPIIASNAASWLRANAATLRRAVVPHRRAREPARRDVVPDRPALATASRAPTTSRRARKVLEHAKWKEDDVLPFFDRRTTTRCATTLPAELRRRPARQARRAAAVALGSAARAVGLHRPDRQEALAAPPRLLREAPPDGRRVARHRARRARGDRRVRRHVVIFTSDHGDMCGSHGLRSKGPFVYEEIMHVPCYVKVPGVTHAGHADRALGTHVDLASTIVALAGVDPATQPSLRGRRSLAGARATRPRRCATTCCSRTTPRTPTRSTTRATRSAGSSTARRSTRATTASAAASPEPDCGARTRAASSTTSTPLRRPGTRVVRPRRRPARDGQPRPRPRPPHRAPRQLRPPPRLRSRRVRSRAS